MSERTQDLQIDVDLRLTQEEVRLLNYAVSVARVSMNRNPDLPAMDALAGRLMRVGRAIADRRNASDGIRSAGARWAPHD